MEDSTKRRLGHLQVKVINILRDGLHDVLNENNDSLGSKMKTHEQNVGKRQKLYSNDPS
jgi:hypothetical protein